MLLSQSEQYALVADRCRHLQRYNRAMHKLVFSLLLVSPMALADYFSNPMAAYEKLQQLRAENKLPGLARDGVTIPQPLLLDKLRTAVNNEQLEVQSLQLGPDKGTLQVLAHTGIDVLLTLDFKVVAVDWPKRSVTLEYREATQSGSNNLFGQALGGVVLTAFEMATGGEHVKKAVADKPYFASSGNRITVRLDQIPGLQDKLNWGVGSLRVFDYVGIKSIVTEKDQLRVKLGTF